VTESVGQNGPLAWMFHAPARRSINTVASARCIEAPGTLQPFQRFASGVESRYHGWDGSPHTYTALKRRC
jgi:hypothetical protein